MSLKQFDLAGQTAIVTGAARGIGNGMALTLADAGGGCRGDRRTAGDRADECGNPRERPPQPRHSHPG